MAAAKSNTTTTQALLNLVTSDPMGFRAALSDMSLLRALANIGVGVPTGIQVLELHAPHPDARKSAGLGKTLCGKNGTRHAQVTCKDCLNRIAKKLGPPKSKK